MFFFAFCFCSIKLNDVTCAGAAVFALFRLFAHTEHLQRLPSDLYDAWMRQVKICAKLCRRVKCCLTEGELSHERSVSEIL